METPPLRNPVVSWLASIRWKDLLKILLALVLVGVVLSKTNTRQILAMGKDLSWPWLAASFLLFCLMTALKGVQYWTLLGRRVPYGQTVRIVVIQNALTNLIAGSAGIASYLTLLRTEQNVKLSRSGIIFIIAKAGDLFSISLFLLISAFLVWGRIGALQHVSMLLLTGMFAALGVFWATAFFRQKFALQIFRILHWLRLDRFALIERGLTMLRSLAGQDHQVVLRSLTSGLVLSLTYMTVTMAYAYCRIQAFHVPLDFWSVIYITALMQLVSLIPIQALGGLGVTELTSLYLFGLFGIVQVDIPAVVIGMRVVFYLFNLVVLLYLPLGAVANFVVRSRRS